MSDEPIIDSCYWCEETKPLYFIDGMFFCCDKCESAYYNDRDLRKKNDSFPLFLERHMHRYITKPD